MVRIIMHGCSGAMERVITGLVSQMEGIAIVAGVDVADNKQNECPAFTSLEDYDVTADVIVDFASVEAVGHLLDYCATKKLSAAVCTTGFSEERTAKVAETAKEVTVLRSVNMSLGVNLLLKLMAETAKTLAAVGFDMEIVRKHHNQKVDVPGGMALALADSLNEAIGGEYHYQYDRSIKKEKRGRKEIGIQSVRGGSIVGEHDVVFAEQDEVVTFSHTAYSKAIFAKDAIETVRFLAGKPVSLCNMSDVIE